MENKKINMFNYKWLIFGFNTWQNIKAPCSWPQTWLSMFYTWETRKLTANSTHSSAFKGRWNHILKWKLKKHSIKSPKSNSCLENLFRIPCILWIIMSTKLLIMQLVRLKYLRMVQTNTTCRETFPTMWIQTYLKKY